MARLNNMHCSQDDTGKLAPGSIGASAMHRQWIGLSVTGDEVTVEPIPFQPYYLQSLDVEVGFLRRNMEIAEQFSTDEMAHNFLKAFNGMIFAIGEILVFDFHGQNLKAVVKGLNTVEINSGGPTGMGILFEKSDINFIKAGDSLIKLKSSSKK